MSRVLGVDPGEARIGLAISDPTETLARPLAILKHISRAEDARAIAEQAKREGALRIIVGVAYDLEGGAGPQARKALRLMEALTAATEIPVEPWDESGSTRQAAGKVVNGEPDDAVAAAFILQEYLDARRR